MKPKKALRLAEERLVALKAGLLALEKDSAQAEFLQGHPRLEMDCRLQIRLETLAERYECDPCSYNLIQTLRFLCLEARKAIKAEESNIFLLKKEVDALKK